MTVDAFHLCIRCVVPPPERIRTILVMPPMCAHCVAETMRAVPEYPALPLLSMAKISRICPLAEERALGEAGRAGREHDHDLALGVVHDGGRRASPASHAEVPHDVVGALGHGDLEHVGVVGDAVGVRSRVAMTKRGVAVSSAPLRFTAP